MHDDLLRLLYPVLAIPVFLKPAVKDRDSFHARHDVLGIEQKNALCDVAEIDTHFAVRQQLNNNIQAEAVGITNPNEILRDFISEAERWTPRGVPLLDHIQPIKSPNSNANENLRS